jgi:TRAP-type C4-dicarboxylate transport system permease small subunit
MKGMLGGIYRTFDKSLNIAMLSKIGNWIVEFAAKVSMISGSVLVAILALFTTTNVILRRFDVTTYGFYEIILLMIVAFVLSGAAYTEKTNGHIRLGFVVDRFSIRTQKILRTIGLAFGLGFTSIFMWRLILHTYSLYERGTFSRGMVNLLHWPAYLVMSISVILFVIILLAHFIQSIRQNVDCYRHQGQ